MDMRRFRLALGVFLTGLVCWLSLSAAPALADPKSACAAPVQTCGGETSCPDGYSCSCVPSCQNCRDCAAQVCVSTPRSKPECRTACECDPGLGCFDGKCIAGFAPVFCCDGRECPEGEQCQSHSGSMSQCRGQADRCDHLQSKALNQLARVLASASRCSVDEDCVRVATSTRCQGTCGAWVHHRRADFVRRTVNYLDRSLCAAYERDGCPYATPRCVNEAGACREGRCQGVPPIE